RHHPTIPPSISLLFEVVNVRLRFPKDDPEAGIVHPLLQPAVVRDKDGFARAALQFLPGPAVHRSIKDRQSPAHVTPRNHRRIAPPVPGADPRVKPQVRGSGSIALSL